MIDGARSLAATLEATPYAARLGLEVEEILGDIATASLPYAADLANSLGYVHGGASASLALWVAMLSAVASDREDAGFARPVSLGINYVAAARAEALHASARIAARGRDIAHVEVEVCSERGRSIALALAVLRLRTSLPAGAPAASRPEERASRVLVSPFSQAMGVELAAHDHSSATLTMPARANEGPGGAVDPGALVALADTCAALACMPSLDQRRLGSATLSLSAVFAEEAGSDVVATGRPVAEDSGICSALVQVRAEGERETAGRPPRHPVMTACVSYRFLAADPAR